MKIKMFLFVMLAGFFNSLSAQQFINKATVEYEVRTNIKKTMGNDSWAEMIKEQLPEFKTGYFKLTFANDKSIYKFDHWDNAKIPVYYKTPDEESAWYYDYPSSTFNKQKNVQGSNVNIVDSIPKLNWKLTHENREIAGFNCRKAVAVIYDSVYVFAFYTEEITLTGGPASINGLPGLILGVTIPRLFTSWIATKVMVTDVDEKLIKPLASKKPLNTKEFKTLMTDRTKGWYSDDKDENKEYQEQKMRFIWTAYL